MRLRSAVVLFALAGCAAPQPVATGPLPKVPVTLVPPSLQAGALAVVENVDIQTRELFAGGEERLLVADGRLWEIRSGQRLVGTVQLSTLRPEADLREAAVRESVAHGLMPTGRGELTVADVPVFVTESDDKFVYLWFGRNLFEVLQIKGTTLEPERVLTELIEFQLATTDGDKLLIRQEPE